ncbi:MAG: hypothetical protein WD768_10005 [Phycisphaeraceae bacterium]
MVILLCAASTFAAPLKIATFEVDVTPPIGTPLCDGLVPPAKEIVDKLSLRGIVFLTNDKPIVLVAVDWIGIGNSGHDAFVEAIAKAAGTTADRVSIHALHPHDAPGCDFSADDIARQYGHGDKLFDVKFARECIERTAAAAAGAMESPRAITHIALGTAKVDRVASNRRILGPLGRVSLGRMSSTRNEEAIAAPEGVIDPLLRLVTFFDGDKPVAVLTWYATHPQSHYGKGGVSCDFVGLARNQREKDTGITHIHFNGAGGNVAAGKYNDGSPPRRDELAGRLAEGMKGAWEGAKRMPISAEDVAWKAESVLLPLSPRLEDETAMIETLKKADAPLVAISRAARDLAYARRVRAKKTIDIGLLALGPARVLHMPGELFVEYQLESQKFRPDAFIAMAAYGDYGPGYIGTAIAYEQGGYETGIVSRTSPAVEKVLVEAMKKLLGK